MAGLSCGIVGLPNVGKSTLFNALTSKAAEASNYPFCTIDPNVGIVPVKDARLDVLGQISKSKNIIYATMEFVDIAGLVEGASKGEGLGNKFLANIRETDAIAHVVRCFDADDVVHVGGKIDPIQDIEVINLELILADLQMCENILVKVEKQARGNKEMTQTVELLKRVREQLDANLPVRGLALTEEEKALLKPYPFLSAKKVLYIANVSEADLPSMDNAYVQRVREYAEKEGSLVVPICAKLEEEISQLSPEEASEFLSDIGLEESGLQRLVKAAFRMLGLITFLTTGEVETRAWPILDGSTAVDSAGKIHTDIAKGFIRAEVIPYDEMKRLGSRVKCREEGKMRSEGRDYIMKDGDVVLFLHN